MKDIDNKIITIDDIRIKEKYLKRKTHKICFGCGEPLSLRRRYSLAKYCSKECYRKTNNVCGNYNFKNKGDISEYMVMCELLRHNFYVFKSSTVHCPFDLIAHDIETNISFRVEVKTAYHISTNNTIRSSNPINNYWDVLAFNIYNLNTVKFEFNPILKQECQDVFNSHF